MALFKILDHRNVAYDPDLMRRLRLLYSGGYDLTNNSNLFLKQLASETTPSFEDRKHCVSYLPYMSEIIDHYAALLFSKDMNVSEASDSDDLLTLGSEADDDSIYKLFLSSADMQGSSLEEVMRSVVTDALIHKDSFIGVDFPKADELPINLLEEELAQTARPYIYYVEPECIVDWSMNDRGKFNWVKIKNDVVVQPDPLLPPMHQIEFKIWTMQDNQAKWQLFRSKEMKLDKQPSGSDDIPLVDEGTTSFREIPILRFSLPTGLALGNKIGPICEDIFQRTSILVNSENKSLNAIRVVFLGDESSAPGGAMPSMVQENPFRHMSITQDWESKGIAVLGAKDKMDVIESKGHAFQIVADQINQLIEKLKEVVHAMGNSASAHNKNLGRSAASKQEDRHSTTMLLSAYGNLLKDFIKRTMTCISSARNEDIVWTVNGLDNFETIDRDLLIQESGNFQNLIRDSKSVTFTRLYTESLYLSLLDGCSHEEALNIKKELQENITEVETHRSDPSPQVLTQEAQSDL